MLSKNYQIFVNRSDGTLSENCKYTKQKNKNKKKNNNNNDDGKKLYDFSEMWLLFLSLKEGTKHFH